MFKAFRLSETFSSKWLLSLVQWYTYTLIVPPSSAPVVVGGLADWVLLNFTSLSCTAPQLRLM